MGADWGKKEGRVEGAMMFTSVLLGHCFRVEVGLDWGRRDNSFMERDGGDVGTTLGGVKKKEQIRGGSED